MLVPAVLGGIFWMQELPQSPGGQQEIQDGIEECQRLCGGEFLAVLAQCWDARPALEIWLNQDS